MDEREHLNQLDSYRSIDFNTENSDDDFIRNVRVQVHRRKRQRQVRNSALTGMFSVLIAAFVFYNADMLNTKSDESGTDTFTFAWYETDYIDEIIDQGISSDSLAFAALSDEMVVYYSYFDSNSKNNPYDEIASMDEKKQEKILEELRQIHIF
ncbi:hypothetical protein K8I28_05105 [bacterium]|nr:hypothetical protein [bacterium]